jgi:hypothetical protein
MAIHLVTGTPGAGKSFYAVRRIAAAVDKGKPVATNVKLDGSAPHRLAGRNPLRRLLPGGRDKRAGEIARSVLVLDSIEQLMKVRLEGRGEGRGVIVLDEASDWLNARTWNEGDRKRLVKWFSRHRHLGWDVYLIVQHEKMIDAQVRALVETEIQLRAMRKARAFGIPIGWVIPWPWFIAHWFWAGANGMHQRTEVYFLDGCRKLYDTHEYSASLDDADDPDVIVLPLAAPEVSVSEAKRGRRRRGVRNPDHEHGQLVDGAAGGPAIVGLDRLDDPELADLLAPSGPDGGRGDVPPGSWSPKPVASPLEAVHGAPTPGAPLASVPPPAATAPSKPAFPSGPVSTLRAVQSVDPALDVQKPGGTRASAVTTRETARGDHDTA